MLFTPNSANDFLGGLENNYKRRNTLYFVTGSIIPLLPDHVWIVVRGIIKLSCLNEQGEDTLLGVLGPNQCFGELLTDLDLCEAKTLSDCDLLCISMEEVESTPHLCVNVMHCLINRNHQSEALIALLGLRGVQNRVCGFLELLAQDYGRPCEQGLMLTLRLTHQEIADALSTTRVTVTRVMGILKDEGWLLYDKDSQIILKHLPSPKM